MVVKLLLKNGSSYTIKKIGLDNYHGRMMVEAEEFSNCCKISIDKQLCLDNYRSKKTVEAKGLYTEITVKEKTGKKISVHCLHNGDTVHTWLLTK
jgi:hypothetical protein